MSSMYSCTFHDLETDFNSMQCTLNAVPNYHAPFSLMASLVVPFRMCMMVVFHEKVFIGAVCGECDGCYAQPREGSFESIEPREWTCISPMLSIGTPESVTAIQQAQRRSMVTYVLAHGSLATGPDDAASLRISKPVRLGRGAIMLFLLLARAL